MRVAKFQVPENCLNAFRDEIHQSHNKYRHEHHSVRLDLSDQLNSLAQSYAIKLARTNTFQHNSERGPNGENLYFSSFTLKMDFSETICRSNIQCIFIFWVDYKI